MASIFEDFSDGDLLELLALRAVHNHPIRAGRISPASADTTVAVRRRTKQDVSVGAPGSKQHNLFTSGDAEPAGYRPLDSVWFGEEDAELIEQLLGFYPRQEPRLILDATVNGRRFWRGSTRPVIGIDVDPRHRPDICADNRATPFAANSFDVVVYDPPHVPNQGRDRSKDFNTRFGLGARSAKENGYTFAFTYPDFMHEAWRVLVDDGVLLCKIADYVHNHRYQWAHVDLIRAGQDVGFTACDCIIKVRKGPIIDPKWKVAHHSRRQHSYWIVFRKSTHCE
jgi:hypothetical protein